MTEFFIDFVDEKGYGIGIPQSNKLPIPRENEFVVNAENKKYRVDSIVYSYDGKTDKMTVIVFCKKAKY